ncbi:MAG: hypothetical protein RL303_177 [Verrucomicrobiota bacterium]
MSLPRTLAFVALPALAYGAYAVYQWTQTDDVPVVKNTAPKTVSPVTKLTTTTEPVKPRSPKTLNLSRKEDVGTEVSEKDLVKPSKPIAELDAKFATWREDGRKAVEEMFGGDRQKIGEAFRASMANEEFRANWSRMRELENQYRSATDDQKQGIMDELATMRSRGIRMLQQAATAPAVADVAQPGVTGRGGVSRENGNGAPAPVPTAPIRFE